MQRTPYTANSIPHTDQRTPYIKFLVSRPPLNHRLASYCTHLLRFILYRHDTKRCTGTTFISKLEYRYNDNVSSITSMNKFGFSIYLCVKLRQDELRGHKVEPEIDLRLSFSFRIAESVYTS